jgi:phytoene dehydrogenase-like protein
VRIVVIGGGFGGLAAAARLAKLGHEVTLLEATDSLGGALRPVEADGLTWQPTAHATLLPAVVRDLFRKSGRPLEREALIGDLEPLEVIREHRFPDRTRVALPGGSRAAQLAAFDELTPGLGQAWVSYVESYAEDWEVLRQHYFEVEADWAHLPRAAADRLDSRESLRHRLHRALRDKRLRLVAGHPLVADGHRLRDVPAWAGLTAYLEQRFGAWTVVGGMHRLTDVLAERMTTRGVAVRTGTPALDLVVRGGRVAGVTTDSGEIAAEAVVVAVDPRRLPALAAYVRATLPAIPPRIVLLGLTDPPDLPAEVVLHGKPTMVVRPRGSAWAVHVQGQLLEPIGTAMARHRLDVRDRITTVIELGPADLVGRWHGSPLGVQWAGRRTVRDRLGPRTPIEGVYAAGAHATPGAGLPFVGLGAALVAQAVTTDTGGGDLRA